MTKFIFLPYLKIYMSNTFTSAEFDIFDDQVIQPSDKWDPIIVDLNKLSRYFYI
jgi:hypothetical protein